MKKKLLNTDLPPACAYCFHGKVSPDDETVLCPRKGVMLASSACKRYIYDPLKRKPKPMPNLPIYQEDEFKL